MRITREIGIEGLRVLQKVKEKVPLSEEEATEKGFAIERIRAYCRNHSYQYECHTEAGSLNNREGGLAVSLMAEYYLGNSSFFFWDAFPRRMS